jgi:HEAT repeat protein
LGELGNRESVPNLINTLSDNDPVLRSAARALSRIGDERAIEPLIRLLADREYEVRKSAIYALGWIGDERAIGPLVNVMKDQNESPTVRGVAAEAFANIGDKSGVEPLIDALEDSSAEVRFWAAFALGQLGDPRALPKLERLVATDKEIVLGWWSVSKEAAEAIEAIKSRSELEDDLDK